MMTIAEHRIMAEPDDIGTSRFWRWLLIGGLGLVTLFLVGVTAGFVAAHVEDGHSFGTKGALILAGILVAVLACVWLLVRTIRAPTGEEPLTRKERLNRNLLVVSGLTGGVMGVMVMLAGGSVDQAALFTSTPLPPVIAAIMVLVIGLIVPAISIYWHRAAVDEQEADAYKTGALYAIYVYMLGAPVWWFAWRGGFVSEPNGIVIYFLTIVTLGAVWLWKKYR